jgi:hypothetical protein
MKLKLFFIACFIFAVSTQAQFNPDAPWMKTLNIESRTLDNPLRFQEIVDAFNVYWETRDPNIKGSGYKPFKRWENYWKNFVKPDGTLPTTKELYNQSQDIKNQKITQESILIDESNWLPVGPFTHTNTGSWSSGQGRVNVIIKDPINNNTYYAGAPAGGFWKSTDNGSTWNTYTDNLDQIGVSGIAITGNTIYIATGDDDAGDSYSVGVMKSTDGGLTFQPTGLNPNTFPNIDSMNDIYINPNDTSMLWVATNAGIYKSIDGGDNWIVCTGTAFRNMKDIKINPTNSNIIYGVSQNRFYKSINAGDTFTIISSGLPVSDISRLVIDITKSNSNLVYLLAADNSNGFKAIYKSSNSGSTFTTVADLANNGDIFQSTQSWYDLAFAVSDTNENEVYVGVLNIWKGTIGTTPTQSSFTQINNWNSPSSSAYTHADIHYLRFFNGELLAGTDGGFYKSTNAGSSFTDLTAGMQISQFYKISVSKQTSDKMVGGLQDNGGHAFSNNNWQNYYGADGMDTAIDPNNSDAYYGFTQNGGGLYISNTAGATSSGSIGGPAGENGNWVTPLFINSESEIYAGYSSLYKVINGAFVSVSTDFGTNIDKLEIDDINPDNIYVATNGNLRKSTNRGVSFSSIESFSSNITSIEVNNSDSSIVYVTTSSTVYKSTDGGNNFTDISNGLPNIVKNVIKHQNLHSKNPLYVGTSLGVYRYDDDTLLWEPFEMGLPNVSVTDLEINIFDDKITAATYGRGVWQSVIPTELAVNDVKLISIAGFSNEINCDTNINPTIEVKNNGTNIINSVNVIYTVDGTPNNFTWNGSIASNVTTTITLPTISLGRGLHTFKANTTITNDAYAINNDSEEKIIYATDSGSTNVVNTLENSTQELLVYNEASTNQLWTRGIPSGAVLNDGNTVTNNVYATNLSGNYPDATKSFIISQCYDLTTVTAPELKFDMGFDLELDWDIVYVEYSLDNGINWNILGTSSDLNWYNSNTTQGQNNSCYNCPGDQWTGTNANLTEYKKDLTAFASETNFMFRIVFHSDESVNQEGVIVDNIVIIGNALSTEEFSLNSLNISPNPSNGIFNITTTKSLNFNYTVSDVTGKLIIKENNVNTTNNMYQINLANYSNGIYFLNIISDKSTITKKLMLK